MANLYDKAGLVNIPVGYQDGFLYNIKPTDNTLGFRFNRDSAATRVNKKGLIEQVGYFGLELVTNGNFDTDSDWVKQSGWSISDGIATLDGTQVGSSGLGSSTMSVTSGKIYKVVVNVISTSSGFRLYDNNGVIAYGLSLGKNVFYRTVTSSIYQVTPLGLSGTTGSIDNVSVQEILGDKPRIDYTDSLTSPSFLLEPQRTNLVTYSEDLSNISWGHSQSSVTLSNITSPDGTQNAYKLTENTATSKHQLFTSISSYTELTISFFAKKDERSFIAVEKSGWGNTVFDLNIGSVISGTGNVIDFGNGWFKCSATYTASPAQTQFYIILMQDSNTNNYQGDGNSGLYLWGFQAEAGSYATSYIPTAGSTVTRAQETCTGAGSASTFNSTEGVLYAEIAALADDETFRMISVSDGTDDNRVRINYTATNQQIQSRVVVGGAQQANISKNLNVTDFTKIALSYKQNQVKLYINGELIGTDTSVTMPSANTFNVLNFDGSNGSNIFYGKTKGVYVFNEALTDDELQQLTGPEYNSFAALAAAYNYTVI